MKSVEQHLPPGPQGLSALKLGLGFRRDVLGWLTRLASYGDMVCMGTRPNIRILLNRPDLVEHVLVVDHAKFNKGAPQQRVGRRLFGDGLLTSEGELWRRQRRLEQPAFQRSHVAGYGPIITALAQSYTSSWREGEMRDITEDMMCLTLLIAMKSLFGIEGSEVKTLGDAIYEIVRYDLNRMRAFMTMPGSWPTPANRRVEQAYRLLEDTVYRIIAEKQRSQARTNDLLSTLLRAMDDDGSHMTAKQVRDETMTLLIAGHETTALAIAWTLHLLAENPRVEKQLSEELASVLGGRVPTVDDLDRLPYLRAVIDESLRLYPPVYVVSRVASEPINLGGYRFPVGTSFLMAPWVIQRSARYFDGPLEFRPERWLDGQRKRLPAYAYFPFGGGPRRCIGGTFALNEAGLIVAYLLQQFSFRPLPGHPVKLGPTVTLRPKYGMKMILKSRHSFHAAA